MQTCQDLQIQLKYDAEELWGGYYTFSVCSLHVDVYALSNDTTTHCSAT